MRVIGRDGGRVLVDLNRWDTTTVVPVALGCVLLDDGRVSPALPLLAFDAAGLYDQPVENAEAVLAAIGGDE